MGAPISPRPSGPSQPCAPITHTMVSTRPSRDRAKSNSERVNSSSNAAITARAMTINSSISPPVAEDVSSAMVAGDRLLPSAGPVLARTMSRRASSAVSSRCSSSTLCSRT